MEFLDEDINVVAANYSEYFILNEDIDLVIFDLDTDLRPVHTLPQAAAAGRRPQAAPS